MDAQIAVVVSSALYGIAWAGIVMLYDFTMSKKNILNWWWQIIKIKKREKRFWRVLLFKVLGGCPPCFGFWIGSFFLLLPIEGVLALPRDYFIFLGFSQLILIYRYA